MFRNSLVALTVLVLAAAGAAQAQAFTSVTMQSTIELHELDPDLEAQLPPDVSIEQTLQEVTEEAEAAVEEVRGLSDPDSLYRRAMDAIGPAQHTLDDAQRQVNNLLEDDEAAPQEEPTLSPQTEESSVVAWPELAPPLMILAGTAAGLGIILWLIGQSATIGAGAAGTAAVRDGRRFLPFASPLFTRFEKDTVLGHPKREAIYGHIISTPGITLQDLCQESGLSRTAVTHHLRLLEQQHLVVSKRVGRSRHFFENGGRYGRNQKDAYAVLHNDRSKEIHDFIQKRPGSIQKDLCEAFDIQASVAHWHVKRLVEAELVEPVRQGRTVSYFPSAPVAAGVPMLTQAMPA